MKAKYLYKIGNKQYYEYKGKVYYVIKTAFKDEAQQHRIEQGFIDGELLAQKYWENKQRGIEIASK